MADTRTNRLRLIQEMNNSKLGKHISKPMSKERYERLVKNQINYRFKDREL